jgi:lipopolysaccharide transport system ATP-binding protein
VRLGFAVATALNPDVLILDEVLAVGDVAFRTKCFQRIGRIMGKSSVIFVSHDPVQISRICDSCLYLKRGEFVALGRTEEILTKYQDDNPAGRGECSVVLDESVTCFECLPKQVQLNWGEHLELTLQLKLSDGQEPGLALLALLENEVSVAQTDITQHLNEALQSDGKAKIKLGPLNLREGTYGLAITILNQSRKVTLVHGINCLFLRMSGPRGYGVPYQLPFHTFSIL